jgi:hypothetical protein
MSIRKSRGLVKLLPNVRVNEQVGGGYTALVAYLSLFVMEGCIDNSFVDVN